MSDVIDIPTDGEEPHAPVTPLRLKPGRRGLRRLLPRRRRHRPPKPKVRKLRLLLILIGLGALAFISTVFGMMMAVASDLPQLENRAVYNQAANSYLYDDHWRPIGLFAAPNHEVIDQWTDISQNMRRATVSVEDRRFWSEPGVDIRGIARAFIADVTGGSRQGASTIAQQFVKNALQEANNRTIFEKLREAALAYHLTREWSKEKILTQYLNSIYFGNGAYGVESAARVYFGSAHGYNQQAAPGTTTTDTGSTTSQTQGGCGDSTPTVIRPKCAAVLAPWEAALLAGMVASPTAFDPVTHRAAAVGRRNLVLKDMYQQHYLSWQDYLTDRAQPLPTAAQIQQPVEPTAAPYFSSWLRPQILAALRHHVSASVADYRAYYGGLQIRTTLDLPLQRAAEQAVESELPAGSGLPSAALVAIDNKTGEVRAMVGGTDYATTPFNLATQGYRQPGSAFKPFTLAVALRSGSYGPDSIIDSAPQDIIVPKTRGREHFIVHNFGNAYSGPISLYDATAYSDNAVFAQVGISVGTQNVARLAKRMGIRTRVSSNYAMILGGLKHGVSPLDMAHAYETFATGGLRMFSRRLGDNHEGPTGIAQINCPAKTCGGSGKTTIDKPAYERVLPPAVAQEVHAMLEAPVRFGTATQAAIPGVDVVGKTGTTSNYGDAWFVGWTPQMTTAVWVGYPTKLVPMSTQYNGQPVEGGTYPAIIWHTFMVQALQILASESHPKSSSTATTDTTSSGPGTGPSATSSGGSVGSAAAGGVTSGTVGTGAGTGAGATGAGATGAGTGAGATGASGTGAGAGATGAGAGATGAGAGAGVTGAGAGAGATGAGTGAGATGAAGGGATGAGGAATGGGGGTTGGGGAGAGNGSGSGGAGLGGGG